MTDPVTNNYSFVQPTVGGDTNTWGNVLNNGVIAAVDAALGSSLAVSITSSDVTLTTAQFQNALFVLSGALTGNRNLIVPLSPNSASLACAGRFIVVNNTTGSYTITVKTIASGSTGVTIPQGFAAEVYSDGTNVNYAVLGLPAYALASNGDPNGQLAGTAASATTNASIAYDYANNFLYVCTTTGSSSTAVWTQPTVTIPRGFDTVINAGLSVTHTGGNLLVVSLKTAAGTDATALNPVVAKFQTVSGSNTTGAPASVSITSALSISSFALGATLGSSSSTPFRFWVAVFNNAGTAVLALYNASDANGIYPIAEYGVASTTAMSGSATSTGVWYTPNGTTLTNCAFRVLGYLEYTGGLATAGTYTSDPNNVVLFGPAVKLPGDIVRTTITSTTATITFNSSTKAALSLSATATLTSPVNLLRLVASGVMDAGAGGGNAVATVTLWKNTGATRIGNTSACNTGLGVNVVGVVFLTAIDKPGASSMQYGLYGRLPSSSGSAQWLPSKDGSDLGQLIIDEIMG